MNNASPLLLYSTPVRAEWIDYNRHMMDGYYGVPFSHASDAFLDHIGLDHTYRTQSGCSTYTAEGHLLFLREMKEGAGIQISTQLLGYDAKRMHLFNTMVNAEQGYIAATCEWMMIHVDVALGKGAPMPEPVLAKLAEIYEAHRQLPTLPQAGRSIGLSHKKSV